MRITKCHIDAFGHFRDRLFEDLDHPIVTVLGPNEAGKSTFASFLRTMLYGIYPVDAGKHVYAPRDGNRIEGRISYQTADGRSYQVFRKLMSTPSGRLSNGTTDEDLRNQNVPAVSHVPENVFAAIYSLSLHEMTAIEGKAWTEVQDRLLGGLSIDFIRPASQVLPAVDQEAGALWRPTQRGNTKAKEVDARLKELRRELKDARDRDDRLRLLFDEIEGLRQSIDVLEAEQTALRVRRRQAERLDPVWKTLRKIDALRQEAGDLQSFAGFPDDPGSELEQLRASAREIDERQTEIARAMSEARRTFETYTARDEQVVATKTEIMAWAKKAAAFEGLREQLDQARRELDACRTRLVQHAETTLTRPWDDDLAGPLGRLSEAELRERHKVYEEAAAELRDTEVQEQTLKLTAGERHSYLPGTALAAGGVLLLILGAVMEIPILPWVGVGLAAMGVVQLYYTRRHNRQVDQSSQRLDVESRRRAVDEAGAALTELLREIPLPEARVRRPDADLLHDLRKLRIEIAEQERLRQQIDEMAARVDGDREAVRALAEACGLPSSADLSQDVSRLEQALATAEERHRQALDSERRMAELEAESASLLERHEAIAGKRTEIASAVRDLGEGDLDRGIGVLGRRREAAREAAHFEKALSQEHPDILDLKVEIAALEKEEGGWMLSDREVVELDERLEKIGQQLRMDEKELATRRSEAASLGMQLSADLIAGERDYLEERLDGLKRDRDRLMLLYNIISRADRRFRDRHQPGVVRRASDYLRVITGGRYERLVLDERGDELQVYEEGAGFPVTVDEPLSRGTRDQIFLAIRLAIMDHLDEGQERLPVFLDEVFVNWDGGRRKPGLEILREMAVHRQVFVFTCHPWLADEIERQTGARRLVLGEG